MKYGRRISLIQLVVVGMVLTVAGSCRENKAQLNATNSYEYIEISATKRDTKAIEKDTPTTKAEDFATTPKAAIPDKMPIFKVININIDFDQEEEQIVITKEENNVDSRVRVIVIDYDSLRDYYRITWQGTTNATNVLSFKISVEDIVGDHTMEIVCSGYNKFEGETLDIFRKTKGSESSGVQFDSVLSISSNGSIETIQPQRDSSYTVSQETGDSYVFVSLSEGEMGVKDTINQKTYKWNRILGKFEKTEEKEIAKQIVTNSQLSAILNGGSENFNQFIDGTWVKENTKGKQILFFNTSKNQIGYYADDIIENFVYNRFNRFFSNRIKIDGKNEQLEYILMTMQITINSIDSMTVEMMDHNLMLASNKTNQDYSGVYYKAPPKLNTAPKMVVPDISGYYKSNTGGEYLFQLPNFTYIETKGEPIKGGYAVYAMDSLMLELLFFDKNGSVNKRERYQLVYKETTVNGRVVRILNLTPGDVTIFGFKRNKQEFIVLEQIEDSQNKGE